MTAAARIRAPVLEVEDLSKSFTLHTQGGAALPVFDGVELTVAPGECLVLDGASGTGKSSLMRMLYANYTAQGGSIRICHGGGWIDMASAKPHEILAVRRQTLGYVSQFLRVIPRVSTLDVVAEPLVQSGETEESAQTKAKALLSRLNIPDRLWSLAPATFSGGERQRVNLARGFIVDYPILLLDEPTAALDAANRSVVIDLINESKGRGGALVGIFHDADIRAAVGTHTFTMPAARAA